MHYGEGKSGQTMTLVHVLNFNASAATLRAIAVEHGYDAVTMHVRPDGRVTMWAERKGMSKWLLDADLHNGDALPTPGDALAANQVALSSGKAGET